MAFKDILYSLDGAVATVTLNRPQYKNALSYRMLDEIDEAFSAAGKDKAIRVLVIRGSGGTFSSGHDLGTPESLAYRAAQDVAPGTVEAYDTFKRYNLDLHLRWRNFPKPTIAMVEGYCIYAGWMMAACCDIVFAASNAEFLAGFVEYMSVPWDVGIRKAKELCFESRFISAEEAQELGFVNRIFEPQSLEKQTYGFAHRVAENSPEALRFAKIQMNKAQDVQGFTNALEDSLGDYQAMMYLMGAQQMRAEGVHRMLTVDLAVKGRKRERFGQN